MQSTHRHRDPVWLTLIPCFLLTAILALVSKGCYHDDDLTHFLMARWSRWYPGYLLHIWGRPGLTIPLALVSWFNDGEVAWLAARLLSCLATAAGAFIAAKLAAKWGLKQAWLVVLACYLQPLSAVLAYTTLTENWAALYLIAAIALLDRGSPIAASLAFSLVLVTRHECAIFIPLWWLALFGVAPANSRCSSTHSAFRIPHSALAAASVLLAPILHNITFRLVFDEWPAKIFFTPRGSTEYLPTGPFAYVPNLLQAVTPFLVGLAVIGGVILFRQKRRLIVAIPAVFFLCQAALKAAGLYASGGYGRFMVTVAPFIAILAAFGFHQLWSAAARWPWIILAATWVVSTVAIEIESRVGRLYLGNSYPIRESIFVVGIALAAACLFAGLQSNQNWKRRVAALLCITCLAQCAAMIHPLNLRPSQQDAVRTASWLQENHLDQGPLFMTHPWLVWKLGMAENPRAHKGPVLLASMPVGTIFIWDSVYSPNDFHGLPLNHFTKNDCYKLLHDFAPTAPDGVAFRVFQKLKPTPLPTIEKTYPPALTAPKNPFLGIYYTRIP